MHLYITIGGSGSRLKKISPKDKHLLYWRDKRIIDWILEIIPNAKIIGTQKTTSRIETLNEITEKENILIIDCDIIPFQLNINNIDTSSDCVFVFNSTKNKYGSIKHLNNKIIESSETNNFSHTKCSGIYFIKNLSHTTSHMTDKNSIVSGMLGASIIYENSFIRLGDIEDYMEAIKL